MKRFLCGVLAVLLPAALCACGTQETATVRLSEVTHSVFYARRSMWRWSRVFSRMRV